MLLTLPDELLEHIFHQIDDDDTLLRLRLTCKHVNRLISHMNRWQQRLHHVFPDSYMFIEQSLNSHTSSILALRECAVVPWRFARFDYEPGYHELERQFLSPVPPRHKSLPSSTCACHIHPQRLLTVNQDGVLCTTPWDYQTETYDYTKYQLATMSTQTCVSQVFSISPDSYFASNDGHMGIYSLSSGSLISRDHKNYHQAHINGVDCNALITPSHFATCGDDFCVHIHDIESDSMLSSWEAHRGAAYCVKFKDSLILSGGFDNQLKVWDSRLFRKRLVQDVSAHSFRVYSISTQGEHTIISGGGEGAAKIWDMRQLTLPVHVCITNWNVPVEHIEANETCIVGTMRGRNRWTMWDYTGVPVCNQMIPFHTAMPWTGIETCKESSIIGLRFYTSQKRMSFFAMTSSGLFSKHSVFSKNSDCLESCALNAKYEYNASKLGEKPPIPRAISTDQGWSGMIHQRRLIFNTQTSLMF